MDVSVIIPVYNAERTILRCLDSVVNQSYNGDSEIIVVNDGSNDNSLVIAQNYASKYNAYHKFRILSQTNKGVSAARNLGLKEATGTYVAFLDSDDEWLENKISKQIELMESNEYIDFLGGGFDGFLYKRLPIGSLVDVSLKSLIFKNRFQPSTVVMKKSIIDNIGFFDESRRYAEEGEFFMRIANQYKCFFLNEKLIVFDNGKIGFGSNGLSANLREMEKGELKNLRTAYKRKYINLAIYLTAISFSVIKYSRRVLITKFNNYDLWRFGRFKIRRLFTLF